jgi:hypothetical protein
MKRLVWTTGLVLALISLRAEQVRAEDGFNFGFHYSTSGWVCCGSGHGLYYNSHPCSTWNPYAFYVCDQSAGAPPYYHSNPLNDWTNYHPHGGPGYGYGAMGHGYAGFGGWGH